MAENAVFNVNCRAFFAGSFRLRYRTIEVLEGDLLTIDLYGLRHVRHVGASKGIRLTTKGQNKPNDRKDELYSCPGFFRCHAYRYFPTSLPLAVPGVAASFLIRPDLMVS